ncbi:MAG: hypothetical protein WKF58_16270 [Ilumatobacteraceae bacterium]
MIESCCDAAAGEHLEAVGKQALVGLRQRTPPGCTAPESELSREDLITNLSGWQSRLYDVDGCPVRLDIAGMQTFPDDDHCFPGIRAVTIGTPLGASTSDSAALVLPRPRRSALRRDAHQSTRSGRRSPSDGDRHGLSARGSRPVV